MECTKASARMLRKSHLNAILERAGQLRISSTEKPCVESAEHELPREHPLPVPVFER